MVQLYINISRRLITTNFGTLFQMEEASMGVMGIGSFVSSNPDVGASIHHDQWSNFRAMWGFLHVASDWYQGPHCWAHSDESEHYLNINNGKPSSLPWYDHECKEWLKLHGSPSAVGTTDLVNLHCTFRIPFILQLSSALNHCQSVIIFHLVL